MGSPEAVSVRGVALVVTAALLGAAGPLRASDRWGVEFQAESATVELAPSRASWWSGRLAVRHHNERGGLRLAVEPQRRWGENDTTLSAAAYRHAGSWTASGLAAATPSCDFYACTQLHAALARRLPGHLVPEAGYRYLEFRSARVHVATPALTWYAPWGELAVRGFLSRNATLGVDARALLASGTWRGDAWELSGGGAKGTRIFDVTALVAEPAPGWVIFAAASRRIGARDRVGVGLRLAREDPRFRQLAVGLSYRRGL